LACPTCQRRIARYFPQWTIPDLSIYDHVTLRRFRKTLVTGDTAVIKDLKQSQRKPRFRPFPLQSSVNLHKLELPVPSLTTVTSSCGTGLHSVLGATRRPHESVGMLANYRENDGPVGGAQHTSTLAMHREATMYETEALIHSNNQPNSGTIEVTSLSLSKICLSGLAQSAHLFATQ
jgi:hypothetical protein